MKKKKNHQAANTLKRNEEAKNSGKKKKKRKEKKGRGKIEKVRDETVKKVGRDATTHAMTPCPRPRERDPSCYLGPTPPSTVSYLN